jgi:hypothetical protein
MLSMVSPILTFTQVWEKDSCFYFHFFQSAWQLPPDWLRETNSQNLSDQQFGLMGEGGQETVEQWSTRRLVLWGVVLPKAELRFAKPPSFKQMEKEFISHFYFTGWKYLLSNSLMREIQNLQWWDSYANRSAAKKR